MNQKQTIPVSPSCTPNHRVALHWISYNSERPPRGIRIPKKETEVL